MNSKRINLSLAFSKASRNCVFKAEQTILAENFYPLEAKGIFCSQGENAGLLLSHMTSKSEEMADRVGFEPTVTLLPHTLSKRAHSTTLTPVRLIGCNERGRKLDRGITPGNGNLLNFYSYSSGLKTVD